MFVFFPAFVANGCEGDSNLYRINYPLAFGLWPCLSRASVSGVQEDMCYNDFGIEVFRNCLQNEDHYMVAVVFISGERLCQRFKSVILLHRLHASIFTSSACTVVSAAHT